MRPWQEPFVMIAAGAIDLKASFSLDIQNITDATACRCY